jgi:hypothetical protein
VSRRYRLRLRSRLVPSANWSSRHFTGTSQYFQGLETRFSSALKKWGGFGTALPLSSTRLPT